MTLIVLITMSTMGIISTQTVDAWHSTYPTKKDCIHFMMDIHQQSLSQAQDTCNNVPH